MAPPKVALTPPDPTHSRSTVGRSNEELSAVTRTGLPSSFTDDEMFISPQRNSKTESLSTAGASLTHSPSQFRQTLSTTTSDDVFVSPQHSGTSTASDATGKGQSADGVGSELDAVKRVGTLEHITLSRPKGPARRRPKKSHSVSTVEEGQGVSEGVGPRERRRRKTAPDTTNTTSPRQTHHGASLPGGAPVKTTSPSRSPKMAAKPGKTRTASTSGDSRVPLMDLTSLAPEDQERASEGWVEGEEGGKGQSQEETDSPSLSSKEISHRIHKLKGVIREFEAGFVAEHGHKPSGNEKSPVRPQLEELSQLRKQLKELKEQTAMKDRLNKTAPPELTNPGIRSSELLTKVTSGATVEDLSPRPQRKEKAKGSPPSPAVSGSRKGGSESPLKPTLNRLMTNLKDIREREGRPENLSLMSPEQVFSEKQSIQKALLYFEKHHGRPQSRDSKETMRPLYDRYRMIKKLIASGEFRNPGKNGTRRVTSPEGFLGATSDSLPSVTSDLYPSVTMLQSSTLTQSMPVPLTQEPEQRDKLSRSAVEGSRHHPDTVLPAELTVDQGGGEGGGVDGERRMDVPTLDQLMNEKELSEASLAELERQQALAIEVKRLLRQVLKEYEKEFTATHGRSVQKVDRRPMQKQYGEYKTTKEKMILIDSLLSKKDPLRTI